MDRDQVIMSGCVSFSGFEGPVSFSSLTMLIDLFLNFFFRIGATPTGMGCSSGSAAVWVALVPVGLLSFPSPESAVQ